MQLDLLLRLAQLPRLLRRTRPSKHQARPPLQILLVHLALLLRQLSSIADSVEAQHHLARPSLQILLARLARFLHPNSAAIILNEPIIILSFQLYLVFRHWSLRGFLVQRQRFHQVVSGSAASGSSSGASISGGSDASETSAECSSTVCSAGSVDFNQWSQAQLIPLRLAAPQASFLAAQILQRPQRQVLGQAKSSSSSAVHLRLAPQLALLSGGSDSSELSVILGSCSSSSAASRST